jgi:hypothetical protein
MDFFEALSDSLAYASKGLLLLSSVLLLVTRFGRKKAGFELPIRILKWGLVIYGAVNIIRYTFAFCTTSDASVFKQRFFHDGGYYAFMMFASSILPLLLLHKKIGKNMLVLWLISLLMNAGWLMELLVIGLANGRDYL